MDLQISCALKEIPDSPLAFFPTHGENAQESSVIYMELG